ncbi:MAG: hypothetical protein IT454_01890 [Planctomycetes bacterium]|nr:hypothetical protein [Planctomycetota bacterium]
MVVVSVRVAGAEQLAAAMIKASTGRIVFGAEHSAPLARSVESIDG